jgi:hypothetical protein
MRFNRQWAMGSSQGKFFNVLIYTLLANAYITSVLGE